CFLDPLHAKSTFLHHASHPHGDIGILLHLDNVGRTFGGERREIFFIHAQCTGDLPLADWSLVVIEIIKATHFERAVVRAISSADAAVVSHDVEAVLAVDGSVDRADGFARRVLAMLAWHWLMHDFRVFRPVATIFIKWFSAGVIATNTNQVHR